MHLGMRKAIPTHLPALGRGITGTVPTMMQRFVAGSATPTSLVIETLLRDGAVIVEGLIDAPTFAAINTEIDPHVAAADPAAKHINPALDFFFGNRTRHVSSLSAKSPTFAREVLCHTTMTDVCDAILLPSCARYHLNIASIIDRGPGAEHE